MRFYGCRSQSMLIENVCKLKTYSLYRGAQVHYGSSGVRKPIKDNGFNTLNGNKGNECRWSPKKGLHLKSLFRRWKKQARFHAKIAIRSLLEEYNEDRVCGECGYPIGLYSNPHNYKGFVCPKYQDNSLVDCWG
jgi:hypothetical protein